MPDIGGVLGSFTRFRTSGFKKAVARDSAENSPRTYTFSLCYRTEFSLPRAKVMQRGVQSRSTVGQQTPSHVHFCKRRPPSRPSLKRDGKPRSFDIWVDGTKRRRASDASDFSRAGEYRRLCRHSFVARTSLSVVARGEAMKQRVRTHNTVDRRKSPIDFLSSRPSVRSPGCSSDPETDTRGVMRSRIAKTRRPVCCRSLLIFRHRSTKKTAADVDNLPVRSKHYRRLASVTDVNKKTTRILRLLSMKRTYLEESRACRFKFTLKHIL